MNRGASTANHDGSGGHVPLPEERTCHADHIAPGRQSDPCPRLHRRARRSRRPSDPHSPQTGRKRTQLRVHPQPATSLGPQHDHRPRGRRWPDRLSAACPSHRRGRENRPTGRSETRQPPTHQPTNRKTKSADSQGQGRSSETNCAETATSYRYPRVLEVPTWANDGRKSSISSPPPPPPPRSNGIRIRICCVRIRETRASGGCRKPGG